MASSFVPTQINWTVYLKNGAGTRMDLTGIQTGQNARLEIFTSVKELYTTVTWTFEASSNLVDQYKINDISIGTPFYFEFYPEGYAKIPMTFKVLSIQNNPGVSSSTLGTSYLLILVSPWYFDQFVHSKAYYGSVSEIMQQMVDVDLKDSFSGVQIYKSSDPPAPRWRTLMKQGEFIQKRLLPFLRGKDNTSSFIFTNTNNYLEVISYGDMRQTDTLLAVDLSNPHREAFRQTIDVSPEFVVYPTAVSLGMNSGERRNLWDISLPALVHLQQQGGKLKTYETGHILQPLGYDNDKRFTFVNVNKNANFTKIYTDDNLLDSEDIFSMKINEQNTDLQQAHHLEMVCYPNLFALAGRQCFYYIMQADQTPSVFSQMYFVKEVTHVFEGFEAKTHLVLEATSFNGDIVGDTASLFSIGGTGKTGSANNTNLSLK